MEGIAKGMYPAIQADILSDLSPIQRNGWYLCDILTQCSHQQGL